jgi:protein involved in polysaccharide export with SLBB domain
MMGISTKRLTLPALAGCLAMLAGCTTTTNEGAERWNAVSAMVHASPQSAENQGQATARCRGPNAAGQFSNATVTEDSTVYRIERGDKLHLSFYRNAEFDRDIQVRPDGRFTIEPLGDVTAAGLTPAQLGQKLDIIFSEVLIEPGAFVRVMDSPFRQVFVGGQVNYPGKVVLKPGMTATQAIIASGWMRDDARYDQIVLIRRDACGNPYGTFVQVANTVAQDPDDHRQDIALLPTDIIVVPRSTIGKLDLFVKQYIRDMFPVEPYLSLGVPF